MKMVVSQYRRILACEVGPITCILVWLSYLHVIVACLGFVASFLKGQWVLFHAFWSAPPICM